MEREPNEYAHLQVGDKLVPLVPEWTEIVIFTDPAYEQCSHVRTEDPDDEDKLIALFGFEPSSMLSLCGMYAYRVVPRPTEEELELYIAFQRQALEIELDNLNEDS